MRRATVLLALAGAWAAVAWAAAAAPRGETRALRILYRPGPLGHEAEVVELFSSLADYFHPADLRVATVAGGEPDRIEVRGPAGELLFEGEVAEGDLYQAQLAIHRHLFPDSACTYLAQVERLLGEHETSLASVAGEPFLFLPPGCTGCLLQKHAARLEELVRERPELAVAAFSAEVEGPLAPLGWRGRAIVLPATAGSTVLSLRRHGVYLPVVARRTGPGRFELRAISAPAPAAAPAPEHLLSPVAVFEGAQYMGEPVDIEHEAGSIYVLDAVEKTIWVIDELSGEVRELAARGEVRFREPLDLFFGCGGRLYVTDLRARAIHELDRESGRWRSLGLERRPFYGGGAGGFIVTAAGGKALQLADRLDCDGKVRGRLGSRLLTGHEHRSVDGNANHAIFATDGDHVAIGHVGLGLIELFAAGGEPLGSFMVDTPEARELRSWYLDGAPAALQEPLTLARALADLRAKAQPDRFQIAVYLGDLQIHAGRVLALCNGVVNAYDLEGRLRARYAVEGLHEGERILMHDFVVTRDGRLLGLDAAHYKKIYDFGPLPGG